MIGINKPVAQSFDALRQNDQNLNWEVLESDHFNFYHIKGSDPLVKVILPACVKTLRDIEDKIGYRLSGRLDIYIYPSLAVLQATYSVQNFDKNQNLGGITLIQNSNIHVAFNGNQKDLVNNISDKIAENLIAEMLFGGTAQERIKYATMMHIPTWFNQGLAQYLARGWDVEADNYLRDGFNNAQFNSFNQMSESEQILVGRSIWHFLEETEGPGTIQRVLYLVRLTRKVETALYFVAKQDSKSLYEAWYKTTASNYSAELKRRMPTQAERLTFPVATTSFFAMGLSPNADYLAAGIYQDGKLKVVLHNRNTQITKTIYSAYKFYNGYQTGKSQLLIRWKNNQELFVVENDIKPKLITVNLEGKVLDQQTLNLDFIQWMDYDLNAGQLAFSAVKNGVSDLYLYNTIDQIYTDLTNDLEDDLFPSFDKTGNLYFSKLVYAKDEQQHTNNQLDIHYIILDSNKVISVSNVSKTNEFDELIPLKFNRSYLSFLSDRNGIINAFAYDVAEDIFALSDYQSNIIFQTTNQGKTKLAEVLLKAGVYQIYISDVDGANNLGSVLHPTNTRTRSNQLEFVNKKKEKVEVGIDSSFASNGPKIYFQSNFPIPHNIDSLEDINEESLSNKVYESIPVVTPNTKLQPTAMYSQLDNSNFLTSKSANYTAPGPRIMNRFGFVLGMRLNDQFNNQSITIKMNASANFDRFQYSLNYINRKGKLTKEISGVSDGYTLDENGLFLKNSMQFLDVKLLKPNGNHLIFGLHQSTRFDKMIELSSGRESFNNSPLNTLISTQGIILRYNNTHETTKWTLSGVKFEFNSDYVIGINESNSSFNNAFKITYGKKLRKHLHWVNRLYAGNSVGQLKTIYFLGGTQNQISPNFKSNAIINEGNRYLEPVYGVRNFDINIRNGNSYAFLNSELLIPAYRWLGKKPLKNSSIQNLWLVIFTDVGTAWYGRSPYDRKNPANRTDISYGALNIIVYNTKNPLVYSLGSGLRTNISGYDIRYDFAFTLDNNVWNKKVHSISLGLPF